MSNSVWLKSYLAAPNQLAMGRTAKRAETKSCAALESVYGGGDSDGNTAGPNMSQDSIENGWERFLERLRRLWGSLRGGRGTTAGTA